MLRFLDGIFVLAILVNLIKGAELLLRPHQETWLKAKLESLTLQLDYTRPIEWYMRRPASAYQLSRSLLIFTSSFVLLRKINYWGHWDHGTFFIVIQSLNLTMLLDMIRFSYERRSEKERTRFQIESEFREGKLKTWLWRSPSILNSLLHQVILAVAGILVVVATMAFIPLLLVLWISANNWALALVAIIVLLAIAYRRQILTFALPLANVGSFAAFNVVLTIVIITVEAALKLLRGFLWRVVEHNKGPIAALTLVITVLLGTAGAYLRFVNK